jgi:membrane protein implicated in regulation of membrane protease activity
MQVVWLWAVLAVVLALVEMHHLAFYAMFIAAAAAAAAVIALFAPGAFAVQGLVFAATTVAGIAAVRPYISRAYERRHRGGSMNIKGVHGGFVGQSAITLDEVGDAHHAGHVRLAGERWLAVRGGGHMIPPGTQVLITAVQGTTLVVWPVDELDSGRSS